MKMQTRNACGRNSHNGRVSFQELPEAWNPKGLALPSDEDGVLHNRDTFCARGLKPKNSQCSSYHLKPSVLGLTEQS